MCTGEEGVGIPEKAFLVGRERLSEEGRQKVDKLLAKYPSLKGFYWAEEKIRGLYQLTQSQISSTVR